MTLNSDQKFEWTLTMWFQKWYEELGELSPDHSKSEKLYIHGLCQKHLMFQLKNFGGIMCHDTESWWKI